MRPCQSLSLSLGPLKYNTSKDIWTVTQALLRPPYQLGSIYWQMQEPTSIYRLSHFPPSTLVPSTPVEVVLNGLHITLDQLSSASKVYYTPIMLAYFKEKHHWSKDTFLSIDYLASDKEYKQLSTGCWLAPFKLQNGLWSTQNVLHQRIPAQYPACPRNFHSPETHDHVLCCPQAQTALLQQRYSVAIVLKSTLHTSNPIYNALRMG
jgi:hypothetical protein